MLPEYNYHKEECEELWRDRKIKWSSDLHLQSEIARFYEGKNIFITGATGFLGKLVVEKLLRACPGIKSIYILVRGKKGEDEKARVDKLYEDEVFSVLRELYPDFRRKIHVIRGDVSLPDAGISLLDQQVIIEEVNVMFHIAATVRFDEKLSIAVNTNIRAVRDLLKLAKMCWNLVCFQHVSTAYANCNRDDIDEVIYEPSVNSDDLIEVASTSSDVTLEQLTPRIIQGWPNTYVFTKQVAEHVVRTHGVGLPVCIFRPAVVMSTYKEPLCSWTDNFYGVTGIAVASGSGVLKTMVGCTEKSAEVVPADYVVNGMIAAAHRTAIDKNAQEIPVYNYVSSAQNRITWHDFLSYSKMYGRNFASVHNMWVYCLMLTKSKTIHYIRGIFLHFFVAIVMDLLLTIGGQKPKMFKLYKKIVKFESAINFFASNEWNFGTRNVQSLCQGLSGVDRALFPCDIRNVSWDELHRTHWLGLRVYLLKDDLSTVPMANRRYERLALLHALIKTAFYLITFGLIFIIAKMVYKTLLTNNIEISDHNLVIKYLT